VNDGDAAEGWHVEAITRLGRTPLRPEIARAHLLYGEWLRRAGRRVDARDEVHTAHDMLTQIGTEAFGERARREPMATGEKVRKRKGELRDELTLQEDQIAGLARDGVYKREIASMLCLSPRPSRTNPGPTAGFGVARCDSRRSVPLSCLNLVPGSQPVSARSRRRLRAGVERRPSRYSFHCDSAVDARRAPWIAREQASASTGATWGRYAQTRGYHGHLERRFS
jgi:hypothetical protein